MDNYLEEICNVVKLPFNEIGKDVKILIVGNNCVYISNYIKILDYNPSHLVVKTHKSTLEIKGENLLISQINKGEIIISGQILSCEFGVENYEKKIK